MFLDEDPITTESHVGPEWIFALDWQYIAEIADWLTEEQGTNFQDQLTSALYNHCTQLYYDFSLRRYVGVIDLWGLWDGYFRVQAWKQEVNITQVGKHVQDR